MSVTIYQVALARGVTEIDGKVNGGEFDRVGLPLLSGCQHCGATLGPGNAYPTSTGFIQCGDCEEMSQQGFGTVEDFERFEAGDLPEPTRKWIVILELDTRGVVSGWDWHDLLDLNHDETATLIAAEVRS